MGPPFLAIPDFGKHRRKHSFCRARFLRRSCGSERMVGKTEKSTLVAGTKAPVLFDDLLGEQMANVGNRSKSHCSESFLVMCCFNIPLRNPRAEAFVRAAN